MNNELPALDTIPVKIRNNNKRHLTHLRRFMVEDNEVEEEDNVVEYQFKLFHINDKLLMFSLMI